MPESQIQVTLIDHMGTDLSIVNAARVSFGKKSELEMVTPPEPDGYCTYNPPVKKLKDQDVRLLKYLAKHKHMSPFGHVFLSFHIKAPIFVARQLVKHKFLRWNEISRRYVDDKPEFYVHEYREAALDKKQGSGGKHSLWNHGVGTGYMERIYGVHEYLLDTYEEMLKDGVAPEQARGILPQDCLTEWYWSGSLDAFADMCRLRIQEDTQYESRVVANQVYDLMKGVFPVAAPLLVNGVLTDLEGVTDD